MNPTVLILDDDAGVLELTALYLKSRGFSTITCDSAACAVEKVREAPGRISILIADVTLPDSSGVQVALDLKKSAPDLKILFVSGYSFEELSGPDSALYHLLPPSSVRFLRKPYSAQDLVAGIMELSSDSPAPANSPELVFDVLERQAGLLDMVHDAVIARTLAGEIRYWNRGAEVLYGWTRQQAIGKSVADLLHTSFPEPFDEIAARLQSAGYWEGELEHRTMTGKTVTVLSRWGLRPPNLRSGENRQVEILEINHDLTAEKQARSELARAERRFRAFWESAPAAVMIVDPEGRILLANSRTSHDFGYPPGELTGLRVEILLPELPPDARKSQVPALRKNGERFTADVIATTLPDGERGLMITTVRGGLLG